MNKPVSHRVVLSDPSGGFLVILDEPILKGVIERVAQFPLRWRMLHIIPDRLLNCLSLWYYISITKLSLDSGDVQNSMVGPGTVKAGRLG